MVVDRLSQQLMSLKSSNIALRMARMKYKGPRDCYPLPSYQTTFYIFPPPFVAFNFILF
jgi:hypothetical protein